jgi:condensin-2 complex subunit G2
MSVTNQFTLVFEAIEQQPDHSTSVASLVALFSSSKDRNEFLEIIKSSSFHKNHARRLFGALLQIINDIVNKEEFIPANAFHDHGEDERRNSQETMDSNNMDRSDRLLNVASLPPVTPDEESTRAMHFMKYTAMMVQSYLTNILSRSNSRETKSRLRKPHDVMDEVKEITEILHNSLFELNSCGREGLAVQKSIVSLCEAYWTGNFVDRNDYVTSLIPLLVLRTLDGNATKADIKRLWDMKDALHLISFQDESVAFLRSLLLRTITSLLYVKSIEGRKMIAHLFQLDRSLVKDLHTAIKVQIPMATKAVLPLYGDIYWRAWKEAAEANDESSGSDENVRVSEDRNDHDSSFSDLKSIKESIEDVLQELMNASVHVGSPHMAKSLRCILDQFHAQKKNPEVDLLLYELYTPILWRSLSAANPMVRVNASYILARTFPLRNPNLGSIHLKEVNDKAVESLLCLLNDNDHKARVAGCNATVQILATTWDALSTKDIRILLNVIITKHAKDASSSAVRAQAINGVSQLLDAPETHGVLKPLLPFLGDLIHDRVEKVRLATVKLLLKLKKTKGFKYYHTVPSNHLLARLAAEGEGTKAATGPVASALTELLSNSFFPLNAKPSEQMRRTLSFLDNDPKAARVFYANIGYQLEIRSVSKLVVLFVKTLKLAVAKDVKNGDIHRTEERLSEDEACSDCTDPRDRETNSDVDIVVASNTKLMAEIACNMLTLLSSVSYDYCFMDHASIAANNHELS